MLAPEHADKIVPGANGVFRPDHRGGRSDRRHLGAHRARQVADDRARAVRARREARGAGAARSQALSRFPRAAGVVRAGRALRSAGGVAVRTAVVLFTRDLRVHDQPALAAAVAAAERVVPLFVLDERLLARFGAPNRVAFLLDSLADLDALAARARRPAGRAPRRRRGGDDARRARDAARRPSSSSEDVSAYAQARERRLGAACAEARVALQRPARRHGRSRPAISRRPAATSTGSSRPTGGAGGSHRAGRSRRPRGGSRRPAAWSAGRLPALADLARGAPSPEVPRGGESEGRRAPDGVARARPGALRPPARRPRRRRHLAALARTCTSAALAARGGERARDREGAEPFVRQLAWRDFYAQLLAARPETRAARLPRRAATAGATTPTASQRGRRAAPATRRRRRHARSSRARAGCTTARACSSPRS